MALLLAVGWVQVCLCVFILGPRLQRWRPRGHPLFTVVPGPTEQHMQSLCSGDVGQSDHQAKPNTKQVGECTLSSTVEAFQSHKVTKRVDVELNSGREVKECHNNQMYHIE